MSEEKQFHFRDVSVALEIIGSLLTQITIPATRAQEFAVTGAVLGELKAFVDRKIAEESGATQPAPETSAEQAQEAVADEQSA